MRRACRGPLSPGVSDQTSLRARPAAATRAGYLLPELERAVRQRSRERILYALVAIYATRHNTLGALLRAQPGEWSATIGVSSDILLDYVHYSETPYDELALRLLPTLPSEASRWPVNDLRPWRELARAVLAALPLPFISLPQLKELQHEAEKLLETLAQVRKASALRQIFRALTEESPLDMVRLFGRNAGALIPHPWIVDHAEPLEKLLTLVRDSSIQFHDAGHMSLFRLLKWINELSAAGDRSFKSAATDAARLDDEIYHLPFPDEKPSEISRRAWLDLLLRSRKRLLLAYQVGSVSPHRSRGSESKGAACCGCKKKKHRHAATTCPAPEESHTAPLPLWSNEEFAPKLAALLNSDDTPGDGLNDLYNRPMFEKEVLPLVKELKRALGTSKTLSPDEKLKLSRLVQNEIGGYASRYCAALRRFYLSYGFHAHAAEAIHSELLTLVNPGSPFLAHLRTVADSVLVSGLDEPYLRSLAQCLAALQPIAAVVYPDGGKTAPAAAADKGAAQPVAARRPATSGVPAGLGGYKEAVNKLVGDLDGAPTAGAADKGNPLADRLSPLGKSALAALQGRSDTALRLAEKFLDDAGITGELRGPFLSPFQAAYRSGGDEIQRALAQHWHDELLPQVAPLFSRFPFNRAADREVAPSELDALNEQHGTFWQDLKTFYAPVLSERAGTYQQKPTPAIRVDLPQDFLPTTNRLARLAAALFRADGNRQPLRLAIRGLPGRSVREDHTTQNTTAFLQVGKAAAYGFNQQPEAVPISVEWWDQGVAAVGMESTTSRTGRRQTQSIEVADSAWSLFRLLQKSTLESDGVSTWRLLGDGPAEAQALRFVINPDPWTLFQGQLP